MKQQPMDDPRELNKQQRRGCRLILFPFPLQGHINPMLQLANILYRKGFSITIIHTNFNSPRSSSYPHFTFISIPDGLTQSGSLVEDVIALISLLNTNCSEPVRDCLLKLLSQFDIEPVSCLVTDGVWFCTQKIAESLNLPRIVLRTSSIGSFLASAAISLVLENRHLRIQDSQLKTPVSGLPALKLEDLPAFETRDSESCYQFLSDLATQAKASSGMIWNSVEYLEPAALAICRTNFLVPIFTIGPFHKFIPASSSSLLPQDQSCISWLDRQERESVLYVSFGSIAALNVTDFLEIACGLVKSEQPFLWVIRPGLVLGTEWTESLPEELLDTINERGHIVNWAPQQEVLAHPATGGFWTHNGWNSTLEGICEGIPMICQPCFGDQKVNARYVTDIWKIGLRLGSKLERGDIAGSIRSLMVGTEGQKIRDRIMRLKEKVDMSAQQGGPSNMSLESLVNHVLSFQPQTRNRA